MKALIIDDSRAMRLILARRLRALGFETLEAGTGREGLDCLEAAGAIDLALVDWNMPGMSGLDFVRAVRAVPAYAGMRLMMVTTETAMEQIGLALESGADEYLMKPFTSEMITEKLQLLGLVD